MTTSAGLPRRNKNPCPSVVWKRLKSSSVLSSLLIILSPRLTCFKTPTQSQTTVRPTTRPAIIVSEGGSRTWSIWIQTSKARQSKINNKLSTKSTTTTKTMTLKTKERTCSTRQTTCPTTPLSSCFRTSRRLVKRILMVVTRPSLIRRGRRWIKRGQWRQMTTRVFSTWKAQTRSNNE